MTALTDLDEVARWDPSPHHYRGRHLDGKPVTIDTIIMHYDVVRHEPGDVVDGRIFRSQGVERSAHIGIGRRGTASQYVRIEDGAFHAGDGGRSRLPSLQQVYAAVGDGSRFVGLDKVPVHPRLMNMRSVGIEHSNRGWAPRGPNKYAQARHDNPNVSSSLWETWSDDQMAKSAAIVLELVTKWPTIKIIAGHDDVCNQHTLGAVGGKTDPGPLFDWNKYRGAGLIRLRFDYERIGWQVIP